MLPTKIKVSTYRELETYFGLKITEFDKIDQKKFDDVKGMLKVISIFYAKPADEVEADLDENDVTLPQAFVHCMGLLSGEPGEPGKKMKTGKLKE